MSTDNSLKRGTFGLLPEPEGRMGSFGMSMVINVTMAALVLLLTIAGGKQLEEHRYQTTELIFPAEQPKPYVPPVPRVKIIPPPVLKVDQPKIELPKPLPAPPKVAEIKLPTPEMPKMEAAPPKRFTPPPQPKLGLFKSTAPTAMANNMSAPTPKAGGFGDPMGVKPNPSATRPATIAAAGAFNAAPGVGATGAGAARRGALKGVDFGSGVANGVPGGKDTRAAVASGGFSNGVLGGTGQPGSHGTVAKGSFGDNLYGSAPTQAARLQEPTATPIVVLAKPLPAYTSEARQLKIEGDVTLQVRFLATGQVEVLRVINGLGHGLDEQAKLAAERIRFKPATKDGRPVDEVSIIHVTFQMA